MQVGQDVEEVYWRPGNGAAFLDLVHQLTGEALTADAWVSKLKESVSSVVQQEEKEYQEAVQQGPKIKPGKHQPVMQFCTGGSLVRKALHVARCLRDEFQLWCNELPLRADPKGDICSQAPADVLLPSMLCQVECGLCADVPGLE